MAIEDEESVSQQQPKRIKKLNSPEASEDHQSVHIPLSDVAIEILLRLPVESLLRFKSVCKSWYALITDPYFVKSHLSLSTGNNHYAHHRLFFSTIKKITLNTCPLYDLMYDESIELRKLKHPGKHLFKGFRIVGYCNGLVCIRVTEGNLFIWNPSTRRSKRLPHHGKAFLYGFGYDKSSDDYKVVAIYKKNVTEIYSLKSGKWNRIGDFPGNPVYSLGTFLNGALHWVAESRFESSFISTIVSLDLATETYDKVEQPVYDENDLDLTIGVVGECLSGVYSRYDRNRADVWVLKVYGVQESWTKLVSVHNLIYREPPTLCLANNDKILLQYDWELVLYDVKNNTYSQIKRSDGFFEACTIVESLVSPNGPRKSMYSSNLVD